MATPAIPNGRTQFFSTIYEGNGSGRRAGKFVPFEDDATIANSCVFNRTDNPRLARTPSSAGNRKTWTFSVWIKRAALGSARNLILTTSPSGGTAGEFLYFHTDNTIKFTDATSSYYNLVTNRKFEDVNKYYHLLIAADTTQATAANRIKMYIDGEQITSFSTETYPSQDFQFEVNNTSNPMNLGGDYGSSGSENASYYFAEVNIVDGTALTPSTFGVTDTTTGRFKPKTLTGITYGTNGFRLKFQDSSALGDDTSGNGNDLTATNLASTDQTLDSPTNNHACWDPNRNGGFTLSEGNRGFTIGSGWKSLGMSMQLNTGKWYWEFKCITLSSNSGGFIFGFAKPAAYGSVVSSYVGGVSNTVGIQLGGSSGGGANFRYVNGSYSSTNMSSNGYSAGAFVQIAYDADAGKIWIGVNNTWVDDASGNTGNPATDSNPLFTDFQAGPDLWANFFVSMATSVGSGFMNWGQTAFNYTPPSGFVAVKQDNFPDLPTGVGIPDLTWIKDRDSTNNHYIVDTSRGLNKYLSSNATTAQTTEENGVVKMLNGGFELSDATITNTQNNSYVGWNWVGNSGTTSTNDASSTGVGTIDSTYQVNSTSGFSIVEYTGTGSNATVKHGLSSAPEWIIIKDTGNAESWIVSHKGLTSQATYSITLNNTNAESSSGGTNYWNSTAPTSSVFSLATDTGVNGSSRNYIAYCWHGIDGYSKFGKFSGNANTNGPFVMCNFSPSFVMVKNASTSGTWVIWDNKRTPINQIGTGLRADTTAADTTGYDIDFLSSGFKIRDSESSVNGSGNTIIYMAFAEHPFVGDGTNPVTAR